MKDIDSTLGFALLGLLYQEPMSGYDLRKVFASTAMGSFSDSPGAIYPALGRLEKRGLVRGTIEPSQSMRKRRVFKVTAKGAAALKAWLKRPVTREDVMRRVGELMLRFAFMDDVLGAQQGAIFLLQYVAQLADYVASLKQFQRDQASKMPMSARLAFESGIGEYEARLHWATTSLAAYEARTGRGSGKGNKR